jgi:hypothetical protein
MLRLQSRMHVTTRRTTLAAALVALLAACDRTPTAPGAAPRRPLASRAASGNVAAIAAQDLGTLPGDDESEATFITEDGAVYGTSRSFDRERPRFFRWKAGEGMTEVAAIPRPRGPALPNLASPPRPFARAVVTAANDKGEATGVLCWSDCFGSFYDPRDFGGHVLRYSPGEGVRELDTRRFVPFEPDRPDGGSHAWSINRWGHIAGLFAPEDEYRTFFWTPLDSFRFVNKGLAAFDPGEARVNDVDQVISVEGGSATGFTGLAWRPDFPVHRLTAPPGVDFDETRPLAQQVRGTLVVGRMTTFSEESGFATHAALWQVPAVNRAAFPSVDANPYGGPGSTLRVHGSSGVRYYQLYHAAQAAASGPYVELVDWGDGTTSRRTEPRVGALTSQSHLYARPGTYWVRVYVEDAQGRWGVDERKLTVTR